MEQGVLDRLQERFPGLDMTEAKTAIRRVYVSVPEETFLDALRFAAEDMGFNHLCTITGLDTGEGYEFLYHVANGEGIVLTLKYRTRGGNGVEIPTVLPIYAGATFYERELEGLLGVTVVGLPQGRQYPLPDNWPKGQYPMRKDWKPDGNAPDGGGRQDG